MLDASAPMLERARERLGNDPRVWYVQARVPQACGERDVLGAQRFDLVILHQGVPAVVGSPAQAEQFGRWVVKHLAASGTLLVAVHDNAVAPPSATDPFRVALRAAVSADGQAARAWRPRPPALDLLQLLGALARSGLGLVSRSESRLRMQMEDRRLMWRSPAVLASVFDLDRLAVTLASQFVEAAFLQVAHAPTAPRRVTFLTLGRARL
jgi:hypothetical protein